MLQKAPSLIQRYVRLATSKACAIGDLRKTPRIGATTTHIAVRRGVYRTSHSAEMCEPERAMGEPGTTPFNTGSIQIMEFFHDRLEFLLINYGI